MLFFAYEKKTAFLKTPTYGLKWTKRLMTEVVLDLAGRGTFHVFPFETKSGTSLILTQANILTVGKRGLRPSMYLIVLRIIYYEVTT